MKYKRTVFFFLLCYISVSSVNYSIPTFIRPPGRAEVVVPQFAGQALVFTPPSTPPRRLSIPETVGTEVQVVPFNGMGTVEFKLQGPFGDKKQDDTSKQTALTRLDELTRSLIESEENYIGELHSIVEVKYECEHFPSRLAITTNTYLHTSKCDNCKNYRCRTIFTKWTVHHHRLGKTKMQFSATSRKSTSSIKCMLTGDNAVHSFLQCCINYKN